MSSIVDAAIRRALDEVIAQAKQYIKECNAALRKIRAGSPSTLNDAREEEYQTLRQHWIDAKNEAQRRLDALD
jgi:hypothetical protein